MDKEKKREAQKKYRLKYPEKIKEANQRWESKNKEKRKKDHANWRVKNPQKSLWFSAKMSSKKKGLEFSIKPEDIIIPQICPFLGVRLTHILGLGKKGKVSTNLSLDRKDSTKGYTKDNIQVISELANRMKANSTKEQQIDFARGVLRMYEDLPERK